jgi:hypothetical protein
MQMSAVSNVVGRSKSLFALRIQAGLADNRSILPATP